MAKRTCLVEVEMTRSERHRVHTTREARCSTLLYCQKAIKDSDATYSCTDSTMLPMENFRNIKGKGTTAATCLENISTGETNSAGFDSTRSASSTCAYKQPIMGNSLRDAHTLLLLCARSQTLPVGARKESSDVHRNMGSVGWHFFSCRGCLCQHLFQ